MVRSYHCNGMSTCPFNSIFLRTANRSFCHFLCFQLQKASDQIINNRKLKNCGSVNRPRPIACVISSLIKVKSSHSKIISYIKILAVVRVDGWRSSESTWFNQVRGIMSYLLKGASTVVCLTNLGLRWCRRQTLHVGDRLCMLVTKKILWFLFYW